MLDVLWPLLFLVAILAGSASTRMAKNGQPAASRRMGALAVVAALGALGIALWSAYETGREDGRQHRRAERAAPAR